MALLIRLIMALFTRPEIGLFHPTLTEDSFQFCMVRYNQFRGTKRIHTETLEKQKIMLIESLDGQIINL